jgi:hypothetical protein
VTWLAIGPDYVLRHSGDHLSEQIEFSLNYLQNKYHASRTTWDRHRLTMATYIIKSHDPNKCPTCLSNHSPPEQYIVQVASDWHRSARK